MSKRIVLLDTGKEWGGGTNSMLELLKRIDRRKYTFTCVFYDDYRQGTGASIGEELARLGIDFVRLPRRAQPVVVKLIKELVRVLLFFNRRLRRLGIFFVEFHLRIRPDAGRIAAMLRERRADLLYLNNQPSSNLEGILAARTAGVPAIQHCRIDAALNPIEVNIANDGLRRVVCVSDGVRQSLVRQGMDAAKCTVVHNGIDAGTRPSRSAADVRATWDIGDDELLIGTVGSLVRRKRVSDLLEVVAILAEQERLPIKCMVLGEGPERAALAAAATRLGIETRVIFTGFQRDAISFINAFQVFVLPSEREGLPRVVLEAMLMSVPVVAADVVGPREVVANGETGFLLPLGQPRIWAEKLAVLVRDARLRRSLGEAGRRRVVAEFSIDRYVSAVDEVLRDVLTASTAERCAVA